MAHTHDVYDTGKHFEINGISRFIRETSATKLVLVQGDHKSEVVTFKMPRFIDGHDMLLCNKIRVHYINIDTKTNDSSADVYDVTDLKLCEECDGEEETVVFTWTIEAPATKYAGSLSFLVKFECTEGDNTLYQWNTARYVSVNVLNGIDNSEEFVGKYSNLLEAWYNQFAHEADTVANLVATAEQQVEECERATENSIIETNKCISATEDAVAVRTEVEKGGFIESLKELNNGNKFSFWIGTEEEYNALDKKVTNCFYIISDDSSEENINIRINDTNTRIDNIITFLTNIHDFINFNEFNINPSLSQNIKFYYYEINRSNMLKAKIRLNKTVNCTVGYENTGLYKSETLTVNPSAIFKDGISFGAIYDIDARVVFNPEHSMYVEINSYTKDQINYTVYCTKNCTQRNVEITFDIFGAQ